ncbi:oligosaccharide repeat unit polymerase [Enterococcus eurekensis]|uniref:Oligosaccharide repeat unit polymerase n=1 Tax=Enterococcus eurekensis TaxID=1159753 RepID=A0ABV9M7M7_9ENTE
MPTKIKRVLLLLITGGIIAIVIISNMRTSKTLLDVFYAYFAGPVVLLSEWKHNVDVSGIWSYGFSFLYPISYVINMIFGLLNIDLEFFKNVVIWQGNPQKYWIQAFPDMPMNAFSTMFYFFYQDLRYLGVMLFSFIFGGISSSIYYKAYVEKRINYLMFYLLIVKAIVGSFMIWQLGSTSFFVSILMMWLCLDNRNTKYNRIYS